MMPLPVDDRKLPLAVFIPDGGRGYVLRHDAEQRPEVVRDERVYTRHEFRPVAPDGPAWYIYTEHPPGEATLARALELLREFIAREEKQSR